MSENEKTPLIDNATAPVKKHSPWNISLIVIISLALIAIITSLITYSIMKKQEKDFAEQKQQTFDDYKKRIDEQQKA